MSGHELDPDAMMRRDLKESNELIELRWMRRQCRVLAAGLLLALGCALSSTALAYVILTAKAQPVDPPATLNERVGQPVLPEVSKPRVK